MLSTAAPRPWLALIGGLLSAAVALALLVELQRDPPQREAVAALPPPPAQPSPFGAGPAVAGPDQPAPVPAAAVAGPATTALPPPPGLSADEWQQLREDLAQHPQREAELARIAQLMLFHKRVQQFRELRAGGLAADALRPLAQQIDAGLSTHLHQRELSAGEARQLKLALLEVLQPDLVQRQIALVQWTGSESSLATAQRQEDAREADYKQREAEAVAAWQARPAAQRDPRELEVQLEALRRQVFSEPR